MQVVGIRIFFEGWCSKCDHLADEHRWTKWPRRGEIVCDYPGCDCRWKKSEILASDLVPAPLR